MEGTQVNITQGSHVWVEEPNIGWIDGQVKKIQGDGVVVLTSAGKEVATKLSKVYPKDVDAPAEGIDDMTELSYLHEPGILHNLATRYMLNKIYTYTGNILIAVNPFQRLLDLYETQIMEQYKGMPLGKLPPHVFAIADVAYRTMINEGKSISILVSGESGAGKTETTKMLMQYLAHLGGHKVAEQRSVEQQVLESNPVLEAFGNAKTVRNDNSSRFGKFVEIQFNKQGKISGAAIRTYLLEKSRVCQISDPERNYHCFYYLCAAPQEVIKKYKLGHPATFHYLNQSSCYKLDGVSDAQQYLVTRQAMDVVGISQDEQDAIFRTVAAILHIGNVTFAKEEEIDSSVLENDKSRFHLQTAAELLMCSTNALEDALLKRVMVTPEEIIKRSLDPDGAIVSRDGLAKTLYSRLFDWLVDKINFSIGQDSTSKSLIGVLDIYGFESFKNNSFEQLCINLTNEKLQQHFNQNIFKMQQEEYIKEEIDWSYIEFVDNQDVLDLIEKKPGGIIALLDETCMFPKSTAQTFAEKLYQTFRSHKRFIRPKLARTEFTIAHYAGKVQYQSDQFMEKNKDYVVLEHQDLLTASQCPFVSALFPPLTEEAAKSSNKCSKFSSIASRFRLQLHQLMETLNSTQPHYIRCVKPNNQFKAGIFENSNVAHQLRCGGVLEAIRISCSGYATHKTFSDFLRRFGLLAPEILKATEDERDACIKIMDKMGISQAQIGKTKVFLKASQMADIDTRRLMKLGNAAKTIQKNIRTHVAQKNYVAMHKAGLDMQSICRGVLARISYHNLLEGSASLTIQKTLRGLLGRRSFTRFKSSVIVLQTAMRTMVARTMFRYRRQNRKATVIQANWRRHRACSHYKRLLEASNIIQRGMRGMVERKELQKLKMVSIIKWGWKGMVVRRDLQKLKTVSITIQCGWRGMVARRELHKLKMVSKIQCGWRGVVARREFQKFKMVSIIIQCGWRGMVARREFQKWNMVSIIIQCGWRGMVARREFQQLKMVLIIQCGLRGMVARKELQKLKMVSIIIQCGWRGMVARRELQKLKMDATRALQEAKVELEEQVEDLTLHPQQERCLRADLVKAEDEEITKLQRSLEATQIKLDKSNALHLKECKVNQEAIEEACSIEESVLPVGDKEKIEVLTSEVAELKKLLQSEKERADNMEKLYSEALQSAEAKRQKLEETERRVHQLQESLNRMISTMSGQFSELKMILCASSNSSSASGFAARDHADDESLASSDTASSDSDFTFPAPASTPPNFSISPGAFHLIVQDLSAGEASGTENWEREREGAFDDFF